MSGHLWLVVLRHAGPRDERELIPLAGGSKGVQVQVRAAADGGVGDLRDPGKSDDVLLVQLIAAEHFGVVTEITQEPTQLPQRSFRAVEPPGKGSARHLLGFKYCEANCVMWLLLVPAILHPLDSDQVHTVGD